MVTKGFDGLANKLAQMSRRAMPALAAGILAASILTACVPATPAAEATATSAPAATATAAAPAATNTPAAVPTSTPAATQPADDDAGRFEYEGISLVVPESLGSPAGESVPAEEGGADAPWWTSSPAHVEIGLAGYPVEGIHEPRVVVYPAEEFASMNEEAAGRIELLRQIVQEQPAEPKELPFLPLFNAAQQMHAQVEYLSFEGGQGVAYLTQYAQGLVPINSGELVYTFQGLTDDGAYYVAALLPVAHPTLPATAADADLADDFAAYIEETTAALDGAPAETFTPSLAELQALVESISVAQ